MNCKLPKIVAAFILIAGCMSFNACGKDESLELQNTIY